MMYPVSAFRYFLLLVMGLILSRGGRGIKVPNVNMRVHVFVCLEYFILLEPSDKMDVR